MRVQAAAREAGEERRADELHEPRADDQVWLIPGAACGERLIPFLPGAEVGDLEGEGGDVRFSRAIQGADAVAVSADRDDGRTVGRVGAGVYQRLQVGPLAGDKHDQPGIHGSYPNRCGKIDLEMARPTDQQTPPE